MSQKITVTLDYDVVRDFVQADSGATTSKYGPTEAAHRLALAVKEQWGEHDHFTREEVGSIYVAPTDRYVVSLVVGYAHDANNGADSPEEAASLALSLVLDGPGGGTEWRVFDRAQKEMHVIDQRDERMRAVWAEHVQQMRR